ncbi:UNVERIFIED_CONTAM: hypothetical protein PYX00_011620 [Menopon gallinae]|uniref:Anti-silencing function protein 1 n=1 Tax=Menopon gallinae TaxID=328185 RepID=A0AAW2H848_9NEOP
MALITFKKITSAASVQHLVDPMKFNVVLECTREMKDDIEFDVVYSGDARCEDYDQKICSMLVGPIPAGKIGFVLETDPVNVSLINPKQIFGVTSVIIIGKYKSQQFLRIGYILNVRYPGIPDNRLVDYEEENGQEEEDIGSSDSESESEDTGDEEVSTEQEEGDDDESASEHDSGVEDDAETEDGDESASEHDSAVGDDTEEDESGESAKERSDEETETNEKHKLRTTRECVENTKYKKNSEQIEEELGEEVHESSFSEIQEKMEETVYCTSEENKIVVNGIALDKTKIEIEFMEPPVMTIFEIDWDHRHTIEEASDEDIKRARTSC